MRTKDTAISELVKDPTLRQAPLYRCARFGTRTHDNPAGLGWPVTTPAGANVGLWYDKFPNIWNLSDCFKGMRQTHFIHFEKPKGRDETRRMREEHTIGKLEWINTVTATQCGDRELIGMYTTRQKQLAASLGGSVFALTNESRFVTGLGREHPIENGFAWHHTLGTPYLSGSGLKGMIRAWAVADGCESKVERLLGSLERGVGQVILTDMLPAAPVKLVADVMTPHYHPYYQDKNGKTAPGDWFSPVPIPFLVCEARATWSVAVLPGSRVECWPEALATITEWLIEALAWQGAGAKTAVGYGRFVEARDHRKPSR